MCRQREKEHHIISHTHPHMARFFSNLEWPGTSSQVSREAVHTLLLSNNVNTIQDLIQYNPPSSISVGVVARSVLASAKSLGALCELGRVRQTSFFHDFVISLYADLNDDC